MTRRRPPTRYGRLITTRLPGWSMLQAPGAGEEPSGREGLRSGSGGLIPGGAGWGRAGDGSARESVGPPRAREGAVPRTDGWRPQNRGSVDDAETHGPADRHGDRYPRPGL